MRTAPYWWEDAGPPRSPPEAPLPRDVDVLVIGAGLTGLSAARTLARAGRAVLALDAGAPGIGASGRNGGMVGGGHRLSLDAMTARFGAETAAGLLREAQIDAGAFARHLMRAEGIECDYVECGRFRGFWHASEYERTARELERLRALMPLEADLVPMARQREEIASDLYSGGVVYPRHGGLNPAKWVAGLMRAAIAAGAMVQGDTAVLSLSREGAGWRAVTARGEVRAGVVLAATNGYTPAMLARERRRVFAVPSFIVATEPLGANRVRSLFPAMRMIVETRDRHCYFRPSPDGTRIVFGGRAAMMSVPEPFARAQLRKLLAQVFPDLRDVGFSHSWRGNTGFTFDCLPHVGRVEGIWHAMGYSGNGNTMAPYLGHKAALQILGDAAGETAFSRTGFAPRWWHRGTPWFLPVVDVGLRAKDILADRARHR